MTDSATRPVPPARRRLVALVAAALVVPALALGTPAPASAAFTTHMEIHGAKLQLCKVPVRGQRPWVRVRLDGRASRHAHQGGLTLSRPGERARRVSLTAAAGRMSATKQLRWRAGDQFSVGINDVGGPGAGGGVERDRIRVC